MLKMNPYFLIDYWHEFPSNFTSLEGVAGQNVSGIGSLFQYGNSVVNGWLGMVIIMMTFAISFISLKAFGTEKAGAVALFGTAFIATLLMRIGLVAVPFVIMLWVAAGIVTILVRNSTNKGL